MVMNKTLYYFKWNDRSIQREFIFENEQLIKIKENGKIICKIKYN